MANTDKTSADKGTLNTLNYLTQNLSNVSLSEVLTEPAKSDESLKNFEKHVKPRILFPDDPKEGIDVYEQMRVVVWQTAAGLKPPSGGFRGNYATLHSLSGHGHKTIQLVWAFEPDISDAIAELKEHKKYDKSTWEEGKVDMLNTKLETVQVKYWKFDDVHGVRCVALDADTMLETLRNELQQADCATYIETGTIPARSVPYINWVVESITECNPTHILFNDALASKVTSEMSICKEGKTCRVEIIHSTEQFPLGPFAGGVPGSSKTTAELPLWQTLDGVVSVSLALQKYIKDYGLETTYIPNHAWSYKDKNTGDWPRVRSNFAKQTVVMVTPHMSKGTTSF